MRDDFLAMVAHELRNPLAPIRNATCVLRHVNARGALVAAQQVIPGMKRRSLHRRGGIPPRRAEERGVSSAEGSAALGGGVDLAQGDLVRGARESRERLIAA